MNAPYSPASVPRRCALPRWMAVALLWLVVPSPSVAGTCTSFSAGTPFGIVNFSALTEASGLAVSARNPKVIWSHNDGDRKKAYAMDFTGRLLARYDLGMTPEDMEDIAIGPGPTGGVNYLYVGDIGGSAQLTGIRSSVKIIRIPEPLVSTATVESPPSVDFVGVETFTLNYPDGSYDCETLMVDPVNSDVYVVTKENATCRLYKANLNTLANGATATLAFVRTINFDEPSGGDFSFDGSQILLRNEDEAKIWNRGSGVSVSTALGASGFAVPVIGRPTEPNGEAIAFLRDGGGYITASEGVNPTLYYFQSQCPIKTAIVNVLDHRISYVGGATSFSVLATGNPAPTFVWRRNGTILSGETSSTLSLTGVALTQGGTYEVTATNSGGTAVASATLTVLEKPDLRITEVHSVPTGAGSDWWELTSFESTAVNLNGWRFNDNADGLTGVFTLPNITIQPGESIVFVEANSAAIFRNWWGAGKIPATTQIITYTGSGLGFGQAGDGVRLWNATTTNVTETVASVDFGAGTTGVSFNYNPTTQAFGGLSLLGVNGVFQAAVGGDLGSPGVYLEPIVKPAITLSRNANQLRMDYGVAVGRKYSLEESDDLLGTWEATGDTYAAAADGATFFEKAISGNRRFYRIRVD